MIDLRFYLFTCCAYLILLTGCGGSTDKIDVTRPLSATWTENIFTHDVNNNRFLDHYYDRSLQFDGNGTPHIIYGGSRLYHATLTNNTWQTETIDDTFRTGRYASYVFDDNDKLHISYMDRTAASLKYATNTSGSWNIVTIEEGLQATGYGPAIYSGIVVDSNGFVHIAYHDDGNNHLKFASNGSGAEHIILQYPFLDHAMVQREALPYPNVL